MGYGDAAAGGRSRLVDALRWLPALAWATLIVVMSSQSSLPSLPFVFEGVDKLEHAGEYGVLALAILYGWRWPVAPRAYVVIAVALVFGASDELHQAFVPGRTADVLDLLADVCGATLCVAAHLYRVRRAAPVPTPRFGTSA